MARTARMDALHPTGQNTYPAGSIRQRILEAAFNLFSESGFSATSMLDIVTRALSQKSCERGGDRDR
jgi:AcrR family transcriptional regulator